MPCATRALVNEELDDWMRLGVHAHHDSRRPWLSYHEQLRGPLARLVGARECEVVAMNSLTANLHFLMTTFYRPAGKRSKLLIEKDAFPSDTYAVMSHVAARGLDRAISNLLNNACKFSPSGSPIEVALKDGRVTVRDHGPGIDVGDLPHVFQRFYRATAARTQPGSGLGLAIVDQVVRSHGGTAFAENHPGGGAIVGFSLPADRTVVEER